MYNDVAKNKQEKQNHKRRVVCRSFNANTRNKSKKKHKSQII